MADPRISTDAFWSRFRAALSDGIVLSKGFDPCVWVHTTGEFEQLSDRFLAPHSPFGSETVPGRIQVPVWFEG